MYVTVVVVNGAAALVTSAFHAYLCLSALICSSAFYVIVTGFCAELLTANQSRTHHRREQKPIGDFSAGQNHVV